MFRKTYQVHGEYITYTPQGSSALSPFKAIIRKGLSFFDETSGVIDRQNMVYINREDLDKPVNGDTFVDRHGQTYSVGLTRERDGYQTGLIMSAV